MGLTIRGQCIPDVAEPIEGWRAAAFWKRGAGGRGAGGQATRAEVPSQARSRTQLGELGERLR